MVWVLASDPVYKVCKTTPRPDAAFGRARYIDPMRRTHVLALLTLVVFLAPFCLGQAPKFDVPSVSTMGQATVKVVPDRVEIVLGVEQHDSDAQKAKRASDAAVSSIIRVAKDHGIDDRDIKTDYIDLDSVYRESGYLSRKTVVITSHDLPGFEALLADLVHAGANHITSVRYQSSEVRKYRDEARRLAAKAALEKTRLLAESLGRRVGNAIAITENGNGWDWGSSWWGQWNNESNLANTVVSNGPERAMADDASIAPGQIALSASVGVTFELLGPDGSTASKAR